MVFSDEITVSDKFLMMSMIECNKLLGFSIVGIILEGILLGFSSESVISIRLGKLGGKMFLILKAKQHL